jgi:2-polyprenyl-3-methyl-5-hydroxy-6-metoxy-1,4-benzoquinol methylase
MRRPTGTTLDENRQGRFKWTCLTAVILMTMVFFFFFLRPKSYQDTISHPLLFQDLPVQACPTVYDLCTASTCGESFPCPLVSQNSPASDVALATTCGVSDCLVDQLMAKTCTADYCRTNVFRDNGQGGMGTISPEAIENMCHQQAAFQVCDDLRDFTGLTKQEFDQRMQRHGHFHFEGEHLFWNPSSATELAWYYTTSVDYLFANSMHLAVDRLFQGLTKEHEPILDYSGGVGNNVLKLASMGIKVQYFGIGQIEKSFAEYRFAKRGYLQSGLVEIKTPWTEASGWKFDPIAGGLPRDGSLGAILAIDVLEHIPNYHHVAKAMVDSLRVGGIFVENTPFGRKTDNEQDFRVHVSDGGISMQKALGSCMKLIRKGRWEKISNNEANNKAAP